jgi:hypothetical protein
MTMWRPSEAVEEDVSNVPGVDPQTPPITPPRMA